MDNALLYVASVYEAFRDQPEKFDEFLRISVFVVTNGVDEAATIAMMSQLMEGHPGLLHGLRVFIMEAEITIPREVEQPRRELLGPDEHNFLNKVKTRFETVDTHVYVSVLWKMKMYRAGRRPQKKMQEEVFHLLYYHEDLIEEFSKLY